MVTSTRSAKRRRLAETTDAVPESVLLAIFDFLPVPDALAAATVCRAWRYVMDAYGNQEFWWEKCSQMHPIVCKIACMSALHHQQQSGEQNPGLLWYRAPGVWKKMLLFREQSLKSFASKGLRWSLHATIKPTADLDSYMFKVHFRDGGGKRLAVVSQCRLIDDTPGKLELVLESASSIQNFFHGGTNTQMTVYVSKNYNSKHALLFQGGIERSSRLQLVFTPYRQLDKFAKAAYFARDDNASIPFTRVPVVRPVLRKDAKCSEGMHLDVQLSWETMSLSATKERKNVNSALAFLEKGLSYGEPYTAPGMASGWVSATISSYQPPDISAYAFAIDLFQWNVDGTKTPIGRSALFENPIFLDLQYAGLRLMFGLSPDRNEEIRSAIDSSGYDENDRPNFCASVQVVRRDTGEQSVLFEGCLDEPDAIQPHEREHRTFDTAFKAFKHFEAYNFFDTNGFLAFPTVRALLIRAAHETRSFDLLLSFRFDADTSGSGHDIGFGTGQGSSSMDSIRTALTFLDKGLTYK